MRRTIRVEFCASLRDQAGRAVTQLETEATTCGGLYRELQEQYSFTLPESLVKFGLGNEICGRESVLEGHDVVVLIPPVCGG